MTEYPMMTGKVSFLQQSDERRAFSMRDFNVLLGIATNSLCYFRTDRFLGFFLFDFIFLVYFFFYQAVRAQTQYEN